MFYIHYNWISWTYNKYNTIKYNIHTQFCEDLTILKSAYFLSPSLRLYTWKNLRTIGQIIMKSDIGITYKELWGHSSCILIAKP
jgi:hypothetical protein